MAPRLVLLLHIALFEGVFLHLGLGISATSIDEEVEMVYIRDGDSVKLDLSETSVFDGLKKKKIQMVYIRHGESMGNGVSALCASCTWHIHTLNCIRIISLWVCLCLHA